MSVSKLRKLAEAATPGPWEVIQYVVWSSSVDVPLATTAVDSDGFSSTGWRKKDDAAFIAAADPQTVLRLLDVVEAAAQVANFDSFFDDGSPRHPTLAAALKALGEP